MTRILVVEDSATQAEQLRLILESEGYAVETAVDGEHGLELLLASPFDLVLSDILMPGLSGYDLARRIKADPRTRAMPVILLTTLHGPMDIIQGLECGADNFLTKPFEPAYLLGRIQTVLANKALRSERRVHVGVELALLGQKLTVSSEKEQILDLLIATFEELLQAKEREHERRVEEQSVKRSQQILQAALDALSADIGVLDETGELIAVNAAWRRSARTHQLAGAACELGQNYLALCESAAQGGGPAREVVRGIREVMASERDAFQLDYPCPDPAGVRWLQVQVTRFEGSGPVRVVVAHEDVTNLKNSTERIHEQASLLDRATDAIHVCDPQDRIVYWNRSAERLYGWTAAEAVGRNANELLDRHAPPELSDAQRAVAERGEWRGELRRMTRDGKEVTVDSRWTLVRDEEGRPKAKLVVSTDITEQKKLEAQLLRAQRMESIGTLAGGIAHDLNNVLTPVLMGVQLLRPRLRDDDSRAILAQVEESANRGGEMVKQILLFARGGTGERAPLELKVVIREIEKMLRRTLPKEIEVTTTVPGDLWLISGDATQLYQVLMNLCVNARDAMPQGGRLTISAANTTLGEGYGRRQLDPLPGPYVVLTVSDTGTGIPAEVLDKVFDPFFTTKEQGKGTGLGLSTALGIVKGHGGFIEVASEPGQGTRFTLHLPAVEGTPASPATEPPSGTQRGSGELILVADDEAPIRELARLTLQAAGYRVLTAGDGAEAVALFAQHRGEVRAVLTDMMMPGMDGPALIQALRRTAPAVRVIAMSGLRGQGQAGEARVEGVQGFLPKPCTMEQILSTVREVLRGPEPSAAGQRGLNGAGHAAPPKPAPSEAARKRRRDEKRRAYRQAAHLAAIVESSDDAVIGVTAEGLITSWNQGATRIFGHPAVTAVGRPLTILTPPEQAGESLKILADLRQQHRLDPVETSWVRRDGKRIDVSLTFSVLRDERGRMAGASVIARDITQRRALEVKLRQAQAMEAAGRLAGGVANDFNNLLTVINGQSEKALVLLRPENPVRDLVEQVRKAGDRAAGLVHQLQAFSRKQILAPVLLDLNELVCETERMLRELLGPTITFSKALLPQLGQIRADAGQIEQVLLNVVENAREAMPQGGTLTLMTRNVELDAAFAREHPEVRPGPYVLLTVRDTGCGMDEGTRARLFEPFFTTKQPPEGAGLGLATVYGIVKQSGGHIAVESAVGEGTTFLIYLPRVGQALRPMRSLSGSFKMPAGTETVLVAEDEPGIRAVIRLALQSSGYTILEARDGEEALEISQRHPGLIHLLVTDLVMPKLGGRQLADRLAALRPGLKVLYQSGYADQAAVRGAAPEAGVGFLTKPFTATVLAQKVREMLDDRRLTPGVKRSV